MCDWTPVQRLPRLQLSFTFIIGSNRKTGHACDDMHVRLDTGTTIATILD